MKKRKKLFKVAVIVIVAESLLIWIACNSNTSRNLHSDTATQTKSTDSITTINPTLPMIDSAFDLNEGVWDLARVKTAIASIPNNGTVIFTGKLTGTIVSYMRTIIYNRNNTIALDLSGCTGLDTIPRNAFGECRMLRNLILPSSITIIGKSAFDGCSGLTSITIPSGVTTIEQSAFQACASLTSITIPEGVAAIGVWAFIGCSRLTAITVTTANEYYKDINGVLLLKDEKTLVCYPAGKKEPMYEIPFGVITIGDFAFEGCSSLVAVTISSGVTSIGRSAFSSCTNLASITIPESITAIGMYAFKDCSSLMSITIPLGVTIVERWSFRGCRSLESVIIPPSVTAIRDFAFEGCSDLTSIIIPFGVKTIGIAAFQACTSLASITIPASVNWIDDMGAFGGCNGLVTVNYTGTKKEWDAMNFNGDAVLRKATKNYNYKCD